MGLDVYMIGLGSFGGLRISIWARPDGGGNTIDSKGGHAKMIFEGKKQRKSESHPIIIRHD